MHLVVIFKKALELRRYPLCKKGPLRLGRGRGRGRGGGGGGLYNYVPVSHIEEKAMSLSVFNSSFCHLLPFHLKESYVAASRPCRFSEFYPKGAS